MGRRPDYTVASTHPCGRWGGDHVKATLVRDPSRSGKIGGGSHSGNVGGGSCSGNIGGGDHIRVTLVGGLVY